MGRGEIDKKKDDKAVKVQSYCLRERSIEKGLLGQEESNGWKRRDCIEETRSQSPSTEEVEREELAESEGSKEAVQED